MKLLKGAFKMARDIVTSENSAEYMAGKLGMDEKEEMPKMPVKKKDDEQLERAKKHPKWAILKAKLGKKGAINAILNQLNMGNSETSLPK